MRDVVSTVVLLVVHRRPLGWDLAVLVVVETKGDDTSLFTALRSKPVCVTFFATILVLGALDGRVHVEHTIIVVSVSVVVGAEGSVDAISLEAVVETHGLVALVTLGEASITVGTACIRGHLPLEGEVGLEEGAHTNNVFTVVLGATNAEVIKAVIAGAEAEANKADVLDLTIGGVHSSSVLTTILIVVSVVGGLVLVSVSILLIISIFLNPLSNGVAAQELDGVTRNPRHIIVGVVVLVGISLFDPTSVGKEVTAHGRV